jgi:hypothetical protein
VKTIALSLACALACALGGCASQSQIGPYVKSVARNGPWLAVTKCTIVLVGEELEEGTCTLEHVPLSQVPMAPASATAPAAPTAGAPFPAPQPIPR